MISKFFIDRPIFAAVLSIVIVLGGAVSLMVLPIAQFPEISPPTVQIVTAYPGADAETASLSVAAPIEQELSGIDGLLYFRSLSSNDGSVNVTLTFETGTNLDIAAVETQNRVKRAEPRLPQDVVRQGITINKASSNLLLVAALRSDDPKYDQAFLTNYASVNLLDRLKMTPGIGNVVVFGSSYAMRIWLDPDRLAARDLTVTDVSNAIREQNGVYAAGRIGAEPMEGKPAFTIPVITRGRLETVSQFEEIVLRAQPDGSIIKLKDVGRVELGSQSYDQIGRLDAKATTLILAYLQPGANALSAAKEFRQTLAELGKSLPPGVEQIVPFDTTHFIEVSIEEVVHTLIEAILLVLVVVYVFLGSWRATVIPLLAVPVAIIGTFTGMLLLGFSINSLTLFGLVLAIGIVVDDAIVVVENVERIMHQEHLPVREATIKAMEQVTGPVIAIVLVLCAVFLPVTLIGGLTGVMYRQFAVTIAISVIISGFVALTLSPALCRLMLKRGEERKLFFLRWFDAIFERMTQNYTHVVRIVIRFGVLAIILFGGMLWLTWGLFQRVPSSFIPEEDQGFVVCAVALPPGAALGRTSDTMGKVEAYLLQQPEVDHVVVLAGYDFLSGGAASTSAGIMFATLKPWDERTTQNSSAQGLIGRIYGHFAALQEGMVLAFNMPSVPGLGTRAGFELQLESKASSDLNKLDRVAKAFDASASQAPTITGISNTFNLSLPQIFVNLNRERAKTLGLDINEIFNTLQAYLGSLYVNDFMRAGRIYRVQLQAEEAYRSDPKNIEQIMVRNAYGKMVALSGVLSTEYKSGPSIVSRFNGYPAVQITGAPSPGRSTSEAMASLRDSAAKEFPKGFDFEWSGASFQEVRAGNQAPYIFAFGILVVFLVLAAQYERWSLPFAVLLALPFGLLGAISAVYLRGMGRDIYFQIGLLTLIGLSSKNAILIVEFCAALRAEGKGLKEAAVEAARLRLRPIIMTSLAFILGVTPLVFSHGAGASGRQSIGTGVMGGMLAATFLAIVFVPLFYVVTQWLGEKFSGRKGPAAPAEAAAPPKDASEHL